MQEFGVWAQGTPLLINSQHCVLLCISRFWGFIMTRSRLRIWVVVKIMVLFWVTPNIRCHIIIGIQKGTIILTTTHMVENILGMSQKKTWPTDTTSIRVISVVCRDLFWWFRNTSLWAHTYTRMISIYRSMYLPTYTCIYLYMRI